MPMALKRTKKMSVLEERFPTEIAAIILDFAKDMERRDVHEQLGRLMMRRLGGWNTPDKIYYPYRW